MKAKFPMMDGDYLGLQSIMSNASWLTFLGHILLHKEGHCPGWVIRRVTVHVGS